MPPWIAPEMSDSGADPAHLDGDELARPQQRLTDGWASEERTRWRAVASWPGSPWGVLPRVREAARGHQPERSRGLSR
jgi:hypothetical protein